MKFKPTPLGIAQFGKVILRGKTYTIDTMTDDEIEMFISRNPEVYGPMFEKTKPEKPAKRENDTEGATE